MSEIKYVWKSIRVPETDYDGCYNCIHTHDSEDVCRVRGCVHAIGQIKDYYKRATETNDKRTETHSCVSEHTETHDCDLISRQDATTIPVMPKEYRKYQTMNCDDAYEQGWNDLQRCIEKLPSAKPEPHWIPFNTRSLTEEEKEDHPEWDCILDCELPDDGQAILVSINDIGCERVQYDEFFTDVGSYLDSGYEIGTEATAWMPLPEPYTERREE